MYMYIHTHIVCFEGEKKAQVFSLPSIRSRDDIIHLQTPYTWASRGAPPAPWTSVRSMRVRSIACANADMRGTQALKDLTVMDSCPNQHQLAPR